MLWTSAKNVCGTTQLQANKDQMEMAQVQRINVVIFELKFVQVRWEDGFHGKLNLSIDLADGQPLHPGKVLQGRSYIHNDAGTERALLSWKSAFNSQSPGGGRNLRSSPSSLALFESTRWTNTIREVSDANRWLSWVDAGGLTADLALSAISPDVLGLLFPPVALAGWMKKSICTDYEIQ